MTAILLLAFVAFADEVPGVDRRVGEARQIALIRAQTEAEALQRNPGDGLQDLLVEEVLKGLFFEQRIRCPAGTLRPGQRAILINPYEAPFHRIPFLRMEVRRPTVLWPIDDAGVVQTENLSLKSNY